MKKSEAYAILKLRKTIGIDHAFVLKWLKCDERQRPEINDPATLLRLPYSQWCAEGLLRGGCSRRILPTGY